MDRWVGKIALVTGAGSGIGASTAEELVKAGVIVFGLDVCIENLETLKEKLAGSKGDFIPLKADVKKENEILEAFATIKEKFGKIHILANCAGICRIALLSEGNINLFKEVFDVNVMGYIICTQQALKLMKESGVDNGHIIFINSVTGHQVFITSTPNMNVYPASKYAITALTESLRQELIYLKTKIRITSISPGLTATGICKAALVGSGLSPNSDVFSKKFGKAPCLKPEDIANAILYVLSTPPHVQVHELIIKPVGEKL